MIFDAQKVLENFGNEPLGEDERLTSHDSPAIDAAIRRCIAVYCRITPHHLAAWDHGFYFQPVLVECDFREFLPSNAAQKAFCFIEDMQDSIRKPISLVEGGVKELPVLTCYILVNRALFPLNVPGETEDARRERFSERRRAIAHELLYANQYALHYDLETGSVGSSINAPTETDEDALICPEHVIEETLHAVETRTPARFNNLISFLEPGQRIAREHYYQVFLRDHCVAKDVSERRTVAYLTIVGDRKHLHASTKILYDPLRGNCRGSTYIRWCVVAKKCPHAIPLATMIGDLRNTFAGVRFETVLSVLCRMADAR